MTTKVIFTNDSALRRKYGSRHARVERAVARLVAADVKRGIHTRLVRIDRARDVARFGAVPVKDPTDARAAKAVVDAVYRKLRPAYVLLLGAPDIVPHQPLTRGIQIVPGGDTSVPSDLPYACDAPASDDASDFTAPTRVVGRLPGITGDGNPSALVAALAVAARWKPRPHRDYASCFAVAAKIMRPSMELSLRAVFGHARDVQLVPSKSYRWPARLLSRRSHFFHCHGVPDASYFEGEYAEEFPTAHSAKYVARKISEGTVAAVECCYGAQLYDPVDDRSFEPMVNAYLRHGAYAYFGSSTTTYIGLESAAVADVICQRFLRRVLAGASTGRAALEARHDFLHAYPTVDGTVLTTLAQFSLFGDPSIHPVLREGESRRAAPREGVAPVHADLAVGRAERRAHLDARGRALHDASTVAGPPTRMRVPPDVLRALRTALGSVAEAAIHVTSHRLHARPLARELRRSHGVGVDAVHVATAVGTRPDGGGGRVVAVAHVQDGEVVSVHRMHARI